MPAPVKSYKDPFNVRLGPELLAYLATLDDAPEFVRQAVRWARDLDLTQNSVSDLVEARMVFRQASTYYEDPGQALQSLLGSAVEASIDALATLERAGWSRECIAIACDALNGTWLTPGWNAEVTRAEIEEADELAAADGQSLCEKHGADPKAFKRALKALDDESARALRVVVTEFWRDNKAVAKRLGYER